MDLSLFCTAFIIQFVGHQLGDYGLQTNFQAMNKAENSNTRLRHSLVYSAIISLLLLFAFSWSTTIVVFILTVLEHMIVDSRKPVIVWKTFFERKISGNKRFNIEDLPFFVLVAIDQTSHITRIFIISLLIGGGVI